MRRVLFTLLSIGVLASVPAVAVARSHHKHHHHKRHHVRTHTFGKFTSKSRQNTPTTVPPASQTAGTVTTFDPATGKLVITLSDGSTTESGLVSTDTEIECQAMNDENGEVHGDIRGDHGPGGGGDGGGDNSRGGDGNGNNSGGGDDNGRDEANGNCSTASLVMGATVLGAELRIDGSGAIWHRIELAS